MVERSTWVHEQILRSSMLNNAIPAELSLHSIHHEFRIEICLVVGSASWHAIA